MILGVKIVKCYRIQLYLWKENNNKFNVDVGVVTDKHRNNAEQCVVKSHAHNNLVRIDRKIVK